MNFKKQLIQHQLIHPFFEKNSLLACHMFHRGATHILRTFFAGNIGSHRCSDPSAVWTVRFLHRYTDRYNNKKHDSAITELDDARIRNSLGSCLALRNSPAIELYQLLGNISEKKTIEKDMGAILFSLMSHKRRKCYPGVKVSLIFARTE